MAESIAINYATNPYVDLKYGVDKVRVTLDDATFRVQVRKIDTDGNFIAGQNPIVDKTLTSLGDAVKYYNSIVNQLYQGDVIRNF